KERQDAGAGVLPVSANDALTALVSFFQGAGQYERGEKWLLAQLEHPAHHQQSLWLTEQLDRLYLEALRNGGEGEPGNGETRDQAREARLRNARATDDHTHRRTLVSILDQVYRVGVDRKLAGVQDDLRAFAFKRLADVLQRQTSDYDSVVNDVAQAVHDLL